MKENCKLHFEKIIANYENIIESNYIKKTKKVKKIIKQFIIENKLILYGGSAIDLLLPKDKKIYNKNEKMFDYDVYSNNAYNHGIQLVDLLYKNNYKYVQLREAAFTQNTFKIFLENLPICDITNIPNDKFELYSSNYSKKKENMLIISHEVLIRDMCAQLSQPHISYFRLQKTYERYMLFNTIYGIHNCKLDNIKLIEPTKAELLILKYLLGICKKNGYPLLGLYALQLLNDKNVFYSINNENSYLSFFASDIENIIIEIKKQYNISFIQNKNYITIIFNNNNICDIYDSSELCVSYCKKKGYKILTVFGIKYFIYNDFITEAKFKKYDKYILYKLNNYIKKHNCLEPCKINMTCYGDGKQPGWQIIKSRWDKGIIKYKPSINKTLETFFNK
tara:strand:- start:2331 stop:3509 length:1179 start_codon:yes stop_codon:yes gene_type:complete